MTEYMTLTDYYKEQTDKIKWEYIIILCYMLILDCLNTIICIYSAFTENDIISNVFLLTAFNSIVLSYCIIFKLVNLSDKVKGLNAVLLHETYRNNEVD